MGMRSDWRGWVLLDRDGKLVAYNEVVYRGVSPRKVLAHSYQRAFLLPHLIESLDGGAANFERVHRSGPQQWRTYAHVLKSPFSGETVGVFGTAQLADEPPRPRPLVGSWEWVSDPKGKATDVRSYWDRDLYTLYDIEPEFSPDHKGAFAPPVWFFKVVSERDSPRLHAMITKAIELVTPHLHTIVYEVKAGYGGPNEHTQFLRLVGRAGRYEDGTIRLSGMSHEVKGRVEEWTPGLDDEIASSDMLSGVMRLTTAAVCLIDIDTGQLIVAAEAGWVNAGIVSLSAASISEALLDSEATAFLEALSQLSESDEKVCSFETRLRTSENGTRSYLVRATSVPTKHSGSRYAMVEFTPTALPDSR